MGCRRKTDDSQGHSALVRSIRKWNKHLAQRKRGLDRLKKTGGRLEYFLGVYINGNAGLELSPELLRETGHLDIELALDIYG
mgnify:CR=1 FL=1